MAHRSYAHLEVDSWGAATPLLARLLAENPASRLMTYRFMSSTPEGAAAERRDALLRLAQACWAPAAASCTSLSLVVSLPAHESK